MSKKGEELLIGLGFGPKKKGAHMEPDEDDEDGPSDDDEDDYSPSDGEVVAAEDLCRHLGIDEEKAPEVARAICQIIDSHKAGG